MLSTTHCLVKFQGVGEDMPNNRLLLSNIDCGDLRNILFGPSKPQLSKFPQ